MTENAQLISLKIRAAQNLVSGLYSIDVGIMIEGFNPNTIYANLMPSFFDRWVYEFRETVSEDSHVFSLPIGKYWCATNFKGYPLFSHAMPIESLVFDVFATSAEGLFPEIHLGQLRVGGPQGMQAFKFSILSSSPWINTEWIDQGVPVVPTPPYEPPPIPEYPSIEVKLPWPFDALATYLNGVFGPILKSLTDIGGSIQSGANAIVKFLTNPMQSVIDNLNEVVQKSTQEGITQAVSAINAGTSHSPEWKKQIETDITAFTTETANNVLKSLDYHNFEHSPLSPEEAANTLTAIAAASTVVSTAGYVAGIAVEGATLGQVEGVFYTIDAVLNMLGVPELTKNVVGLPLDALLIRPAKYHYNSLFTPEYPSSTDLINMVVKEKIPIETFKTVMKYNGLSEDWSQKIWDAHFIAPSLSNLLTSWRRNHINTEELERYQILVDLDPIYSNFWEDARYVDPSITEARFMFETGAIGENGVKDILRRNGLFPADIDAMSNFITGFQERLWRRRYIVSLAGGYRKGVFGIDRLRNDVLEAGYTSGVANWIIKNEDAKREIENSKSVTAKEVLLTLALVKDAFIHRDIDESYLNGYFMEKGYDPFEVSLAVKSFIRARDKSELEV